MSVSTTEYLRSRTGRRFFSNGCYLNDRLKFSLCFLYERAAPSGHFGFGVYESRAAYTNLSVYRPFIEPRKCQYAS